MEFNSELHKVLTEYETQMYRDAEGLQFIVFIPFGVLEEFTATLSPSDFDEGGVSATLTHGGTVCINLRDLFECNEYKLNDYKACFGAEDFQEYQNEIIAFDAGV